MRFWEVDTPLFKHISVNFPATSEARTTSKRAAEEQLSLGGEVLFMCTVLMVLEVIVVVLEVVLQLLLLSKLSSPQGVDLLLSTV